MAVMSLPDGIEDPDEPDVPLSNLRRAITLPNSHILKQKAARDVERAIMADPVPYPSDIERPKTRADCIGGPRPCPWVSCKYNNYLDVDPVTGALKIHRPDLAVSDLKMSCVLDQADLGGLTLEKIAKHRAITRERVRQQQVMGLAHMKAAGVDLGLLVPRRDH